MSDGSTSTEHPEVDHHQLKVDMDVKGISSFADTDKEEEGTMSTNKQNKWADRYLAKNTKLTVWEYFIASFFKYLKTGPYSCQTGAYHSGDTGSAGRRPRLSGQVTWSGDLGQVLFAKTENKAAHWQHPKSVPKKHGVFRENHCQGTPVQGGKAQSKAQRCYHESQAVCGLRSQCIIFTHFQDGGLSLLYGCF